MKAQRKDPCFRDPILIFNLFQKSDRLYFEALERHELFKRFFIPLNGTFLIEEKHPGTLAEHRFSHSSRVFYSSWKAGNFNFHE